MRRIRIKRVVGVLHECLCRPFLQNSLYSLDLFLSLPFCFPCSHCAPCSERRKRLFVQDPLTCKCSCKFTQLDCKSRQLELNERTCRFVYHTCHDKHCALNPPLPLFLLPSACLSTHLCACGVAGVPAERRMLLPPSSSSVLLRLLLLLPAL